MKKKKLTKSEQIEADIRAQFLGAQFANTIEEILQIELNAKWRATAAGKKDAEEVEQYTPEDLEKILGKQQERRKRLLPKVEFLRKEIDE